MCKLFTLTSLPCLHVSSSMRPMVLKSAFNLSYPVRVCLQCSALIHGIEFCCSIADQSWHSYPGLLASYRLSPLVGVSPQELSQIGGFTRDEKRARSRSQLFSLFPSSLAISFPRMLVCHGTQVRVMLEFLPRVSNPCIVFQTSMKSVLGFRIALIAT